MEKFLESRNNFIARREAKNNTFEPKIEDLSILNKNESIGDEIMGSISLRKDGRYMGRFFFGGERITIYGKSKTDCINKMRDKKKELKELFNNTDTISKKMFLNTFFDFYYLNYRKNELKESSYLNHLENYDRYIRNDIGKLRVNIINSIKIQSFVNNIKSDSVREKLMQILKKVFDIMHKESYIVKNPMNLVTVPTDNKYKIPDDIEKVKLISYNEELILLDAIKNANCYHAVKFILYSGLRRGECLGLKWDHIDFENKFIYVKQQFNAKTKKISSVKSKAAVRKVPLFSETEDILKELIKTKNNDFIFNGLSRLTSQVCYFSNKLNIDVNPHTLRHTFASRLYACKLDPKVIQLWLGHENMSTTLDTYTHVLDNDDFVIINKIRAYLIEYGYLN